MGLSASLARLRRSVMLLLADYQAGWLRWSCCLVYLSCIIAGGASAQVPPAASKGPVIFLLGGTNRASAGTSPVAWPSLLSQAREVGASSILVVLGDYLNPQDAPGAKPQNQNKDRLSTEDGIRPWLLTLREFPGRVVFVPGEAEWQQGGARGWERVRQQEALLAAEFPGSIIAPTGGCPGPVEIALDATHTLVVLDTQWWLHAWDKPGPESACEAKDPAAVVTQLDDVLSRNRDQGKHLLVAGHHPLFSSSYSVSKAALPNPRIRLLRKSLTEVLNRYSNLTYVSGHEPSLQYLEKDQQIHYVVSGAGAVAGGRTPRHNALFAERTTGFSRLTYELSDRVVLTLHNAGGQVLYQRAWEESAAVRPFPFAAPDEAGLRDSLVVVRAGEQYRAGRFKTWLMGSNYRAEWAQPVAVPMLDLGTMHGGLTPLKRGGGLQTKSLRLRGGDGREYVLRSVSKEVDRAVPSFLRRTLAADVVQDQISASHPYAALTVLPLAEAVGVPHTHPQVVFVPDDPRLGPYRRAFAGTVGLLEARDPSPPMTYRGVPLPKAYSTQEVLDQLRANPGYRVDQRQVLRARLLDILLADWDRHDDQWRWLAYPQPDGGRLFRAAPRDRDQAYFVNQGFLPRKASSEWTLPKFQGFDYTFRNVNSFNFNGRYFDRSFLTGLEEADWRAIADSVRASLPDSIIVQAIHQLPDSVFALSGPTLVAKLQAHRDHLPEWAGQYYRFLAREVDVVGTDQADVFVVERIDDAHTRITVRAAPTTPSQQGELRYERTFLTTETKEVRLFGLEGEDMFTVRGSSGQGLRVRIIGGGGTDSVVDVTAHRPGPRRTVVYDEPTGVRLVAGPDTRNRISAAPDVNTYDRQAFRYDYTGPLYPLAYNLDDGVFVGLGVLMRRPGFRREPWASTHRLTANVALATGAFTFAYDGQFHRLLGPYDLLLAADLQAPNYVRNFFGLGNTSRYDQEMNIRYYRVRYRHLGLSAQLQRRFGDHWRLHAGPLYQAADVERSQGRFITQVDDPQLRPVTLFGSKQYLGGRMGVVFDRRTNLLLLPEGATWRTELTTLGGLLGAAQPLTQLTSELALYRSIRFPVQLTLATRFGGAANLSRRYEFFQAATLDGLTNLRGYRRTRFAGRQSAYNNTELRLQVGRFRSYLFPATFGLLGFHDMGRVWVPGENSRTWHRGYGGGVWLAPFQQVVVTAMYGLSPEDRLPLIRLGYFF